MLESLLQGLAEKSTWEWIAVILSIAYVLLAAKESIWCWPAAFVSTVIYTWLFYEVNLLMDSALNVYYMAMAIYGFIMWRGSNEDNAIQTLQITSWSVKQHSIAIICLTLLSLVIGWLVDNFTPADFAYLDSATTVFAVFTTWLVARKILENWLYWIVIDFVSIYLYFSKSMMPTAALFVVYVAIAIMGYFQWQRRFQEKLAIAPSS